MWHVALLLVFALWYILCKFSENKIQSRQKEYLWRAIRVLKSKSEFLGIKKKKNGEEKVKRCHYQLMLQLLGLDYFGCCSMSSPWSCLPLSSFLYSSIFLPTPVYFLLVLITLLLPCLFIWHSLSTAGMTSWRQELWFFSLLSAQSSRERPGIQ